MKGRSFQDETYDSYRFGFNGMEKDGNFNAKGDDFAHYDFGARMYDSRIGKFLSTDPLSDKFTSSSPYNFVLNNPINFIDPNGEDTLFVNAMQVSSPNNGFSLVFKITLSLVKDGVSSVLDADGDVYFAVQEYLWRNNNIWYTDEGETFPIRFENYTGGSGKKYKNSIRIRYATKSGRRVLAHKSNSTRFSLGCQTCTRDPSKTLPSYDLSGNVIEKNEYVKGVGSQEILNKIRELYDKNIPSSTKKDKYGRTVATPKKGYDFLLKTHSRASFDENKKIPSMSIKPIKTPVSKPLELVKP